MPQQPITYDLKNHKQDSSLYYQNVKALTAQILSRAESHWGDFLDQYCQHLKNSAPRELRTRQEHLFEILLLAVLWDLYSPQGSRFVPASAAIVKGLYRLRKLTPALKKPADFLRGIASALLLTRSGPKPLRMQLSNIRKTLGWLAATGEYNEEVKRLHPLTEFLTTLPSETVRPLLQSCAEFAPWFQKTCQKTLGDYTSQVGPFCQKNKSHYHWREDNHLAMRQESEYHLNMVGAVLMNQAFRTRFLNTKKKLVLIPRCMTKDAGESCAGRRREIDIECVGCSKDCQANQLIKLGKQQNFEVKIVPHSSNFTKALQHWQDQEHTGVIGVACVLNLLTGGYEMRSLRIPAQCVLLEHCGCKKHWDKAGRATEINQQELLDLLQIRK